MGLLADVYSYGDTLKRKVGGLMDDPKGTLEQMVGRYQDDQRNNLNLQDNAFPMAGDRTVLNTPQQVAVFRKQLADVGANMGMAAATVYHGSPYKFDKFDSSKIGTGEGGAAWGKGIYLSDSDKVAKQYSDVEFLKKAGGGSFDSPGYLYKVDLPNDVISKSLLSDKSLINQPKNVQDIFKSFLKEYGYKNPTEAFSRAKMVSSQDFGKANSGNGIYEIMRHDLGEKELINRFSAAGIPGIRYLDGGSRGAGTGSSNYVIFPQNEGLLSILERNGQAVK